MACALTLLRLSSLAFETFLFALTLIVFFRVVRREYGKSSIIHVFVRDGTWAFALIFGKTQTGIYPHKPEEAVQSLSCLTFLCID